ncbi:hypothetical protein OHA98_15725 [Streptomyces sp. NBC_00654]|uniref:hypothetical protein n=1 Tax=Streptomyces sp. NBC_00654 TaxID=2975799 RepID=UPI00225751DC|nr:hypothetical protein [Streptomyces sp. NBC_00654]MCX4966260.1 hypothetical protein [Streptomyces sp. NBC_00654]
MSHPQSYEILLVPEFKKSGTDAPRPGRAIRSAVVAATGETGASGYPRYEGEGVVADIDPATRTVEALLVDGAELDYGLSVRISEKSVESGAGRRTGESAAGGTPKPGDSRAEQPDGEPADEDTGT